MEINELFDLLRSAASGERAVQTAAAYRPYPLKLSFSSYNAGIAWLCEQYEQAGLSAQKIDFPADGETIFADRHFPLAWDIEDGWLKASCPGLPETLASYREDPYGIVPFSADSNGEQSGVIIPAQVLKEGKLDRTPDNIVVLFDKYPSYIDLQWAIDYGCKASAACAGIDPANEIKFKARRWFNDHFGEGQINAASRTLPAYSLPPQMVAQLLEYYKQRGPIPAKYCLRAKAYAGTVAAALATLEGSDPEEKSFMLTAHAYEPNASNNVSGVAICFEAARVLADLIRKGSLPRPRRGIQCFHGMETFGLYAYAMKKPEEIKRVLCGQTIECSGYRDRPPPRENLQLLHCSYIHPSFSHALAEKLIAETSRAMKADYEVIENGFSSNDEFINDPMFGPAWNHMYASQWIKTGFYHTNADTIENLSPERMAEGAVFAAASAYLVASAGKDEALSFARLTSQSALKHYNSECANLLGDASISNDDLKAKGIALHLYNKTVVPAVMASIESAVELVPARDDSLADARAGGSARGSSARESEAFKVQVHELALQFQKAANGITSGMLNNLAALLGGDPKKLFKSGNTAPEKEAAGLVPSRRLPGILGLGTQSQETRTEAAGLAGYYLDEYWNFMGPQYYWFDGKWTVLEAAMACYATTVKGNMVSQKTRCETLERFMKMTSFLEKHGYLDVAHLPAPPIVTREMLVAELKKIGIKAGDLVMVHSSLSAFGEVQGGPDTVIDALMELVTAEGVLAMPAFTATADGEKEPAFDPKTSKDYTGAISDTFWRRKGVLRHGQYTHSLAAWGKRAAEFLKCENLSDTFDWHGPWGNLYRWNGKILNFGETMGATTYLHALEAWFLCYLDKAYARVKDGDGEAPRGKPRGIFAEPCDLSGVALAKTEAKICGSLLRRSKALGCEGREPQGILAKKGEKQVYICNYPNGCRGGWYGLRRAAAHYKRLSGKGLYREAKIGAAAALVINVRDLTKEIHALLKEDPAVFLHKSGCLSCAERRARLVGWTIPDTLPDNTPIQS